MSITPNMYVEPSINKVNEGIGKNIFKGSVTLCKKLSVAYICLFSVFAIYMVLLCYFFSINNLFYETKILSITVKNENLQVPYQVLSSLTIGLIVPIGVVFGVSLGVIDIFLIFYIQNLPADYLKLKKCRIAFIFGFLLVIPSWVTCFFLIVKLKKSKTKNLENKEKVYY